MANSSIKVEIDEDVLHKFPFDFENSIRSLLKVIPSEHLAQLSKIHVVNFSPEKKQASGFYCGKREGVNTPSIIICAVDLFGTMPKIIFYIIPFIPRLLLADTLYHEIGHHYQRLIHGIKKEQWENFAEKYNKEMSKKAFMSSGIFKAIKSFKFIFIPVLRIIKHKIKKRCPSR